MNATFLEEKKLLMKIVQHWNGSPLITVFKPVCFGNLSIVLVALFLTIAAKQSFGRHRIGPVFCIFH